MHNNLNPQPPPTRIQHIQKQLNIHCCHYDSLMPLLQLHTFDAAVYRWENSFKNINRNIWEYEGIIDGLCEEVMDNQNESQSETHKNQLAQIQTSKSMIEAMASQVQQITKTSSQQLSQILQSPEALPLLQFQSHSQTSLSQLHKYIQMSLALLKNQLYLKQLSASGTSNPTSDLRLHEVQRKQFSPIEANNQESQLLQNIEQTMFYGLHKEIQSMRSDLPSYDIEEFHVFTFNRLTKQILQIDEIIQLLSVSFSQQLLIQEQQQQISQHKFGSQINSKEKTSHLNDRKIEVEELEQKIDMINWQIRGMRKKYLHVISRMYEEVHQHGSGQRGNTNKKDTRNVKGSLEVRNCYDGYDVNCLQTRLANGISTLSDAYIKLLGKVEDLKKQFWGGLVVGNKSFL